MSIQLFHGDCLEVMRGLPDGSVDLILSDLPYGMTDCDWDDPIPLAPLWEQYWRVLKPNCVVVLTSVQPFTTSLIASQMAHFKYCWIWRKSRPSGFVHAPNMPLKDYEDVAIFSKAGVKHETGALNRMKYFPQGLEVLAKPKTIPLRTRGESVFNARKSHRAYVRTVGSYPRQVLEIASEADAVHPTQKPLALFEYLIKTYSELGDVVLDSCCGSGTAGVACVNLGRGFIGIEKNRAFYELARARIYDLPKMKALNVDPRAVGARQTHFIRTSKHEAAIQKAIKKCKREKIRVTKTTIAQMVGLSRQQVSQRYAHLFTAAATSEVASKAISSNSRRNRAARELAKIAAE